MNLNDFEKYVERRILERGREYYDCGNVISLEELERNIFAAKVEGTDIYSVSVNLDDDKDIISTECDCPYDMGNYCKHQVSVFLALRNGLNTKKVSACTEIISGHDSDFSMNLSPEEMKFDNRDILTKRTKEELVDVILDLASEDEETNQRIGLHFFEGSIDAEVKQAARLIRTCFNQNTDRHGYVDYSGAYEAVGGADAVLEKARKALETNKSVKATCLAICVISEMLELLDYVDDSAGCFGGVIDESFCLINECIAGARTENEKLHIFEKLADASADRRLNGWCDWQLGYLECCSKLADIPRIRASLELQLTKLTENRNEESWSDSYFVEKVKLIRYGLIESFDSSEKTVEFIERNLKYPAFREMAINRAMGQGNFDFVEKLALEGEQLDSDKRGLVIRWKEYRYQAYVSTGNLDKLRAVALDFIFEGKFDYYLALKATFSRVDWLHIYPQIIEQCEKRTDIDRGIYSQILIEESEKQKLLAYVSKRNGSVNSYYSYLLPEFKDEVIELFLSYIEYSAAKANGRKAYQGVCSIIKNLKNAGGKNAAAEVKQKLLATYRNRPAFRDELSKV